MKRGTVRGSSARARSAVIRRSAAVGALISLVGATAALAAHPVHGALYKGSESSFAKCVPQNGLSCTFAFRVSRDGKTMRFVSKKHVVGTWACHGGGGEATFGPNTSAPQWTPVPRLKVHADGSFAGSTRYGSTGHRHTVRVSGRFKASGKTATMKITLDPGPQSCVASPIKLAKH